MAIQRKQLIPCVSTQDELFRSFSYLSSPKCFRVHGNMQRDPSGIIAGDRAEQEVADAG